MRAISFFIPHIGCPVRCSFCNQNTITGRQQPPDLNIIRQTLTETASKLKEACTETQVAFFGGSFTAIDSRLRKNILDIAKEAVQNYGYSGIRFSTRPDSINEAILQELSAYPIQAIELGAQSMNDHVLAANNRGHSVEDTMKAAKLIKNAGYELTLQMMLGLYKDTIDGAMYTASKLAELQPQTTRIYPTIVLKDTHLAELYNDGSYVPLTLEQTIETCAELLEFFESKNIGVIKLGLHDEQSLTEKMLAGPHHPALRELCEGYNIYKRIKNKMQAENIKTAVITVPAKEYSKIAGHKSVHIKRLKDNGFSINIKQDTQLNKGRLLVNNKEA